MSPSRSPLVISVVDVLRHLGTRLPVAGSAVLDGLAISTARVPDGATISYDLAVESTASGAVAVTGTVSAPWVGECRRCLAEVHGELTAELAEVFEARPVEGETYPLADDRIDLEPAARDAVLLALPLAPLCAEGCAGPEPEAFPVLTETEAEARAAAEEAAAPPRRDPRWAALDALAGPDEGN